MNNPPRIPDPETRARSVTKLRQICAMFDAQIMVLDELIAHLEAENRSHPMNIYRRKKGKRLIEDLMQKKPEVKLGE